MINKINTYNYVSPSFRSNLYKPTAIKGFNISHLRNTAQKVNLIKSVCDDIFSAIRADKNIISKVNSSLSSVSLDENSISFLDNLEKSIRYSKEKINNKDLFIMEILDKNIPHISITLDTFGTLMKTNNENNIDHFDLKEINIDLLEKSINQFYETTDEPLFNVRMFIRKICQTTIDNNLLDITIKIPETINYTEASKNPKEQLSFIEQKSDLLKKLPKIGDKHNYSYKEVITQYKQTEGILDDSTFSKIDKITQKAKKEKEIESKRQASAYKLTGQRKTEKTVTTKAEKKEVKITTPKIKKTKIEKNILPKTKKENKIITKPVTENENLIIGQTKRRGRPRKNIIELEATIKVNNNETQTKRRGRPKKETNTQLEKDKKPNIIKPAGIIDLDSESKVNKIFNLYNEITNLLNLLSGYTRSFANTVYKKVEIGKRQISIENIDVHFFKRKTWNETEALSITDSNTNHALNIVDSSKLVSPEINLKKVFNFNNTKFLTQEEIENEKQKNILSNILNQTILKFEDYKTFLERKSWRSVERRTATPDEGKINNTQLELLKTVEEKYNQIRSKLQKMNSNKSYCIKRDYGIVPIKSARLEFIDAHKDGYNLIFSKAKTKYGNLYIVVKHSGKDILEEVFAISEDGKLVKNINKNFGLNKIINHKEKNIKFLNNELIEKENLLSRLEDVLNSLNKKMDDCEDYIKNYQYIKNK